MYAFPIGVSALSTGRAALDLIGQNIANANTPGYARRSLNLVNTALSDGTGIGVAIGSITRFSAPPVRTAILSGNAQWAAANARMDVRRQLDAVLAAGGPDGLGGQMEAFFNQADALSSRPADAAVRRTVVSAAGTLADRIRTAAGEIDRLRADVRGSIAQTVEQVNGLTTRIGALNAKIAGATGLGQPTADLIDRRDKLVDDLSKLVDLRTVAQPDGTVNVIGSGGPLVVADSALTFTAADDPTGRVRFTQVNGGEVAFAGGKLGGLTAEYNVELPATRGRLDGLARAVIRQVNGVQAVGLGADGPVTSSVGTVSFPSATAPLASQNLPFPITAGELVVSVTDTATGTRTNATISIDPSSQSITDIADAVTAATGGQVTGSVDPVSNTLRFDAQSGFQFDFAGRTPNPPAGGTGGSSTPQVGGVYTGQTNDVYTFAVSGNGTVGVTPGLSVQVRDAANNVVATVNVGAGYAPGTPLSVGNGVTVQLPPGTVGGGSFSAPLVAYPPDSAGLLAGSGVGGLFAGTSATDIQVRPELLADPNRLAVSRSGLPGDASNLAKLSGLRDQSVIGNRTLTGEATDLTAAVGTDVTTQADRTSTQAGLLQALNAQEQSVTGVDINEEFVKLVDYQRYIEAASRYISAVNTALDSIVGILR